MKRLSRVISKISTFQMRKNVRIKTTLAVIHQVSYQNINVLLHRSGYLRGLGEKINKGPLYLKNLIFKIYFF